MVSPLQSNSNAELQDDKSITNFGDLALRPDIRPEILVRLSGKLQTTLDIHQLLEIFFKEIQAAVLVDGLIFNHPPRTLHIQQGKTSAHSVSYKLQTQKQPLGELIFQRSTRFREHELANIEGLLSTMVYPMRNGLQYLEALTAAYRDPLTGAGNRVALEKTLDREIGLARRQHHSLSIFMVDLDHFKTINDSYGHSFGDNILRETVIALEHTLHPTDLCFRVAGEEFLVIINHAETDDVNQIAECMIKNIVTMDVGRTVAVSASIGFTTLNNSDTTDTLMARVQQALQQAKSNGGNRAISANNTSEKDLVTCR